MPPKSAPRVPLRRLLLTCCAAMALIPAATAAQEAAAQQTQEAQDGTRLSPVIRLPEITLTATGGDDDANSIVARELAVGGKVATSILDTPASVSVVTQAEIERRDARTLEDVLDYTAGAVTDYYGTDDRNDYFQIRGFDASTYRDGITIGGLRGIREEPLAYERVEVIRGANSTLFGPADPGGSINFVTKRPRAERFSEVFGTVGSDSRREYGFDFGDVLNPEATLSWRLTGKLQDAEREYDFSRDDETFLMGGLTWQPSDVTSLSLIVDHLERDATPNSGGYPRGGDYDRGLFLGEPDFNYLNVDRTTVSLLAEHDFGAGLTLRSTLRYSDTADDYGYVYISGDDGVFPVGRDFIASDGTEREITGNVIVQYDRDFGRLDSSTLAGVEYRSVDATARGSFAPATSIDPRDPVYTGAPDDLTPYLQRRSDTRTKAVFVQQNLSLDDRFIATLGLRRDQLDIDIDNQLTGAATGADYSDTTWRAALTWKVTPQISAYGSYVESIAPPSIEAGLGTELQRGEQYELGVKYEPANTNALFSAAIYDLSKTNISVRNLDTNTVDLLGKIRVKGLDLEAKAELTPQIAMTASYSYADPTVVRSDPIFGTPVEGNTVGIVPAHIASLWVDYTLPGDGARGDMTFGLGARYTGTYFFATQNDTGRSEASVLLDAAYSYDVTDATRLSINVQNLTDEQVVVGRGSADFYNPGRSVSATLRHAF